MALRVTSNPANNGLFYLHSDHLGSVSAISDANGALVPGSLARYTPFGGWRTEPTAGLTDRGFTGHKQNAYIKLIDMRARWYDPVSGRFISPDTIVPDPANPQSFNRYSYVENRVMNFNDPTGHCGADTAADGGMDLDLYFQCLDVQYGLQRQYDIEIGGYWLLSEMELLRDSLQGIVDAFAAEGVSDPIGAFQEVWGGVKFKRNRRSNYNTTTVSKNFIRVTNLTFMRNGVAREDSEVMGTFAHELMHVWDRREGYELAEGLKGLVNGSGEHCLWMICTGNYTVGDSSPHPGDQPKNSREDLAWTFATYVINPQQLMDLNSNTPFGDQRSPFISELIQQLDVDYGP
ncbi:MAG: RHS repeat domain-containing protein [Anaerolineae bacterium]